MNNSIKYTHEQILIGEYLKNKNNIIVDAVAGSGKTTTINYIINLLNDKNILTILYSKFLKIETESRIFKENVDIKTIHGICQSSYGVNCSDDFGIKYILRNNLQYRGKRYDIIIIDEAQDLTPLLVRVILKIISDSRAVNLLLLGDNRQCIYKFKGADERFLSLADRIFQSNMMWTRLRLSETFRCSVPITNFINKCMLNENRLVSNRYDTIKPIYISKSAYVVGYDINKIIDNYLKEGNTLNDIAILAYSVKGIKTPVNALANYLSSKGKIIYKSNDDYTDNNDEILMKNKIVLTTFHQMKGRQRKMVILFGFDNGYYNLNPNDVRNECPNLLYVAATRARDRLIIIQDNKMGCLPFINIDKLKEYTTVKGELKKCHGEVQLNNIKFYSVSELVRFMPNNVIEEISNLYSIERISNKLHDINFDTKINFDTYSEDVSFIYGSAIPIIKQYSLQNYFAVYESLKKLDILAKSLKIEDKLNHLIITIENLQMNNNINDIWRHLPYIINMHHSILERMVHPLNQISHYLWFYEEKNWKSVLEAVSKLDFLDVNDEFEKKVEYNGSLKVSDGREIIYFITGSIDCINKIYGPIEFKLVTEFKIDHLLQSIVYLCMLYLQENIYRPHCLYNIRTGEMFKINIRDHEKNAHIILQKIINNKIISNEVNLDLLELLRLVHSQH